MCIRDRGIVINVGRIVGAVALSVVIACKGTALLIEPVSYTHLDVYKRQVIMLQNIGRCIIGVVYHPVGVHAVEVVPVSYTHLF